MRSIFRKYRQHLASINAPPFVVPILLQQFLTFPSRLGGPFGFAAESFLTDDPGREKIRRASASIGDIVFQFFFGQAGNHRGILTGQSRF